jgi:hypothetical protein
VEINFVRVEITLVRVVGQSNSTFGPVKFTLRVEITL